MVAEAGAYFLYRFLSIDAEFRAKQAKAAKTDLKFKIYLSLLRAGGAVTPQSKLLDWYIYDGETYTKTEKIIRYLSRLLTGFVRPRALETACSEHITSEEVFDQRSAWYQFKPTL